MQSLIVIAQATTPLTDPNVTQARCRGFNNVDRGSDVAGGKSNWEVPCSSTSLLIPPNNT
jgi:hypothetical protein